MALTKEQVANRSLALIGAEPITSFEDEDSQEAEYLTQIYDGLIESVLTQKPWRFAMKQAELDRLGAVPVGRWDAAYQLPSDLLALRAITINDCIIDYDRYDNMIYCNASTEDTLVADYIYKADPSTWLPYFTQGVVYLLAGLMGGALARSSDLVDKYTKMGEAAITKAANIEAQSQTTKHLRMNRFLAVRGNTRAGGFRDDGY